MNRQHVCGVLREALARVETSFVSRLIDSTAFVGWEEAEDLIEAKRIAKENSEHQRWLAEALIRLRSGPGPRAVDVESADLHYQDLDFALPRVAARELETALKLRALLTSLSEAPAERELLSRIAQRHEAHAKVLTSLQRSLPERMGSV